MELKQENLYISAYKNGPNWCGNTDPSLTTQPNTEAVMAKEKVRNSTALEKEIWKAIPDTKGFYEVSNKGRVRSWHNNTNTPGKREKPRILKQDNSAKHGYSTVCLRNNGKRWTALVHRLVAEAFLPNPENKPQVNHKNGCKTKNWASNLEWVTRSENQQHGHENGLMNPPKGKEHWNTELTENDVLDIRAAYATGWFTQKEIAECYDMCRAAITNIINRKTWRHV